MSAKRRYSKRLFHYTRAGHLHEIFEAGFINVATGGLGKTEKGAVWCSFDSFYEPTAIPGVMDERTGVQRGMTFEEFAGMDPPCRFEVRLDAAPLNWKQWEKASGVGRSLADGLKRSAVMLGANPNKWRMSLDPILQTDWLSVEGYVGGEWREIATRE